MPVSLRAPRPARVLLGAILLLIVVIVLFKRHNESSNIGFIGSSDGVRSNRFGPLTSVSGPRRQFTDHDTNVDLGNKAVVVASIKGADTSWVAREFDGWKQYVYVADDVTAPLHLEQNKGNEANAYLTYIIEHYDRLPSTIVFLHHHAWSFHVDNAFSSNAETVHALNLAYVQREGYASLRCMSEMGCICAPMRMWDTRDKLLIASWPEMFPNERLPETIVAPCCAQFAVSRAQVRARPLADYQRIHTWLMSTDIRSSASGRILEHTWHLVFGRDAVHCPDEDACYCDKFGLCEDPLVQLNKEGKVRGQRLDGLCWLQGHSCAKWPSGLPKKVPWAARQTEAVTEAAD